MIEVDFIELSSRSSVTLAKLVSMLEVRLSKLEIQGNELPSVELL
jgi:hypothetical protein